MTEVDQFSILIIDDEANMRHMLGTSMEKAGYEVTTAGDGNEGLQQLANRSFDFILCDLKMPGMDGLEFLEAIKKREVASTIIMMSAYATIDTAVQAMQCGAYDFITKPFKTEEVLCILEKASERVRLQRENETLRRKVQNLEGKTTGVQIIGDSKPIRELLHLIEKVARYDTTVLVTGESGTGKELVARAIYETSSRFGKGFVSVNCGALPVNLIESEFFGYKKGAFSGAEGDRKGLFAEAEGGVLFLDEIGELPLDLQVKLLRVLQEREVRPVGATTQTKVDVRVIAATAKNLAEEVEKGRFRQDLYYRLNVVGLHVPPLRERMDDIVVLSHHFLQKLAVTSNGAPRRLNSDAIEVLLNYDWPGNVRELENCLERAVVLSTQPILGRDDFALIAGDREDFPVVTDLQATYSLKEAKLILEQHLIAKALLKTGGNKSRAAELLEISYPSLLSKIKEYGLS